MKFEPANIESIKALEELRGRLSVIAKSAPDLLPPLLGYAQLLGGLDPIAAYLSIKVGLTPMEVKTYLETQEVKHGLE